MLTSRSLRRVLAQEPTPGIVNGVAVVQRGHLVEPIAMRLDAAAGHWELVELQYLPAAGRAAPATSRHLLAGRAWASAILPRAAPPLPLRWWRPASCGQCAPSRGGGGLVLAPWPPAPRPRPAAALARSWRRPASPGARVGWGR